MPLDLDITQKDLQNAEAIKAPPKPEEKKVSIPTGSLCRMLIYNIDTPRKAKEDAVKFRTKTTLMQGADLKMAAVSYFDEHNKEQIVIDYSGDVVELPLGEKGFKNFMYFRCSEKWLNYQNFLAPQTVEEARLIFNLWMEKQFGIPADFQKGSGGILFNSYRTWRIDKTKPEGQQYSCNVGAYDYANKKRLTTEEVNVQLLDEALTAKIWTRIDETAFDTKGF